MEPKTLPGTWALILAAGEGSRLRTLTASASGGSIPKQFCSLHSGPSLLHEALGRAYSVVGEARTAVIVAQQHRRWWQPKLVELPPENIIVQPRNRGTALGILLPLLQLMERDPQARILMLPSDHHVRDETILARSMRQALSRLGTHPEEIVLLGLTPEQADPEFGYIVPGSKANGALGVRQFVEKPPTSVAHELIQRGGLWNSFILAATARALLGLFERSTPQIVASLKAAVRSDRSGPALEHGSAQHPTGASAVTVLYEALPEIDFSRHVLPGQEAQLRVLRVPQCGWSDLGTPRRISEALLRTSHNRSLPNSAVASGYLSLAARLESLQAAAAR